MQTSDNNMFRCKIEDGEASPTSHFCGRPHHVKLPVSLQAAGMASSNGRHDHGLNSTVQLGTGDLKCNLHRVQTKEDPLHSSVVWKTRGRTLKLTEIEAASEHGPPREHGSRTPG